MSPLIRGRSEADLVSADAPVVLKEEDTPYINDATNLIFSKRRKTQRETLVGKDRKV
jgi:hypothetical protein